MYQQNSSEKLVFRQVAFPVSAFDYLKEVQREHERQTGAKLTNNQVLALILAEHQQSNEERGARNESPESKAQR
jgi:hypothetical protein